MMVVVVDVSNSLWIKGHPTTKVHTSPSWTHILMVVPKL